VAETIHVFVADDHPVVRTGLEALIDTEPGMEVVGTAADGEATVRRVLELKPDVILMDLKMPRKSGQEAIEAIKESDPEARILVLTSFGDDDSVFAAIKAGALGFLLKDSRPMELIHAIRNVHAGKSSLHPDIALKLVHELSNPSNLPPTEEPLTEREEEVVKLVAQGLSNQEIAERLSITERTVRAHVSSILSKLQLANRTQAALYALKEGLASLDDV
jgi:NarL family two-component system response regulator LiaR